MDSPDVAMKPNNWLGNYPRLCIKTAHQQVKSMRAFRGTTPRFKRCSAKFYRLTPRSGLHLNYRPFQPNITKATNK